MMPLIQMKHFLEPLWFQVALVGPGPCLLSSTLFKQRFRFKLETCRSEYLVGNPIPDKVESSIHNPVGTNVECIHATCAV